MRRLTIAAAAIALLAAAPSPAPAAAPTAKQVKSLKAKVRALTRQRDRARREATRLDGRVADLELGISSRDETIQSLTGQNTALQGTVNALNGQVAQLNDDNAKLRAGLPDAIKAVPQSDFYSLVLAPARASWPCTSYYSSGGYWSLEFSTPGYC